MNIANYGMYFLITPTLGLLRDLSKEKKFCIFKFIRTPLFLMVLSFYYRIRSTDNLFKIIIYERWIMLFYKTCYSFLYNDHIKKEKKLKYKQLLYENCLG